MMGQVVQLVLLVNLARIGMADLDALGYFFEIDTVETFDGPALEQSEELVQEAGSTTMTGSSSGGRTTRTLASCQPET